MVESTVSADNVLKTFIRNIRTQQTPKLENKICMIWLHLEKR